MPFQSKAQQGYAYAHPEKFGGKEKLKEWAAETDFAHLPEKKKKKSLAHRYREAKHG